ncbi:UNVERIFIED_CONTAM: class I heat shock protein, partial [Sesamum angustifolium]
PSTKTEERAIRGAVLSRAEGRFMRRFRLPENAKVKEVKASMEKGVLTVTVPKPEIKSIDIS